MNDFLRSLLPSLPSHTRLVVVSKTRSLAEIQALYDQGLRLFGENRVQELLPKYEALPKDINWHLIGHLQRNKVKYIAPFVAMIHSVDSPDLFWEIEKQAEKLNRKIPILLQFHVAQEETKFGFDYQEALDFLSDLTWKNAQHVEIQGIMGMASFSEDQNLVRSEFARLHQYFNQLKAEFFAQIPSFSELSMGMSSDYQLAIEQGSTLLRIGTRCFE